VLGVKESRLEKMDRDTGVDEFRIIRLLGEMNQG
jgi:hypothetical protein